jgi:hypothetical protein
MSKGESGPTRGPAKPPAFTWQAHDGPPASPDLAASSDCVLVRYMFEGGKLARDARLVVLVPEASPADVVAPGGGGGRTVAVTAEDVLCALRDDGVDMAGFYATAYEEAQSGGAWVRLLPVAGGTAPLRFTLPLPPLDASPAARKPRIDVKICREAPQGRQAALEHYGACGEVCEVLVS